LRSPDAIIGRCLSIHQAVTFGGMAVGSWVWGSIADWQDLPTALYSAAAFLVVSLVALRIVAPMPEMHPDET
jgi:predicted MFS family arabinose efflux permease